MSRLFRSKEEIDKDFLNSQIIDIDYELWKEELENQYELEEREELYIEEYEIEKRLNDIDKILDSEEKKTIEEYIPNYINLEEI